MQTAGDLTLDAPAASTPKRRGRPPRDLSKQVGCKPLLVVRSIACHVHRAACRASAFGFMSASCLQLLTGSGDCKSSCAQVHGPQQEMERLRDELVRAHSINGRLHLQVCTPALTEAAECISPKISNKNRVMALITSWCCAGADAQQRSSAVAASSQQCLKSEHAKSETTSYDAQI